MDLTGWRGHHHHHLLHQPHSETMNCCQAQFYLRSRKILTKKKHHLKAEEVKEGAGHHVLQLLNQIFTFICQYFQ